MFCHDRLLIRAVVSVTRDILHSVFNPMCVECDHKNVAIAKKGGIRVGAGRPSVGVETYT